MSVSFANLLYDHYESIFKVHHDDLNYFSNQCLIETLN